MSLPHDEHKIGLIGGLILIVLTLSAGISVYTVMQRQAESNLSASLKVALQNKISLFNHQINKELSDTQIVAKHLSLTQHLELTKAPQGRNEQLISLSQISDVLLQNRFSGIVIYDNKANKIVNEGHITQNPALMVQLKTEKDIRAFLLWKEQFLLRIIIDIKNQAGQHIGNILTEKRQPILSQAFNNAHLIGETGDFMLCAPAHDNKQAMDCFLHGIGDHEFKRVNRIISNQPLPMHYALEGKSGIMFAKDYRQEKVVAAHSPMAYGLGTVLKIDEKELYQPITQQIRTIFYYLTILVLCGMAMLYWLMMPLVRKLVKSEQKTLGINTELLLAKEHAEQASTELAAYIDAIGELTLISIASRDGRILQVNEKFSEVSGYSQQELVGQNHRILNSDTHKNEFFTELWTTIKKGNIWHREICNRKKDGSLFWVDTTIVPIMNKSKQIDRFLSARVDITAKKQKDLELSERLKEISCLHSVGRELRLNLTIDETCPKILDHIEQAMQFPETAATITLNSQLFTTEKYNNTLTRVFHVPIIINGKTSGQLQTFYPKKMPFLLPEEQSLIDIIANDLSRWLERKQVEQRILDMATHDTLTGLPNRVLLQDRIQQVLAHDKRNQKQMAVLFIDLDHFKVINDSLGHDVGDCLLKEVSKRLIASVRNEDAVARQGGDEFIVVLQSIAGALDAGTVAQKILDALIRPYQINKKELHIGGSIGIAIFPEDGNNAETLLKNSDVAMYHAKVSGRNNYQFFTQQLSQSAHEKHTLSTDLRYALERNELILFYQPVINMPNYELHGMEVLLRWQHPEHGLISPLKFIGLAEETGLIIPIGEWVLQTACKQIKTWHDQGYEVPQLAINLSTRQFRDNALVNNITQILDKTGIEASHITLEITESLLVDDIEKVVNTLNQLSNIGLQISIDDFGIGYSSLSYLKRFPINTLKIDRSFVQDIITDSSDRAIVAAIIAMANSLKIDIIAEGVETEEQLNFLIQQGCNRYQGYFFSKPFPASEIKNKLKKHLIHLPQKRHSA